MIHVTPKAASKIATNLDRRGRGIGIRIGVRTTGCSGLAYVLEYVDQPVASDIAFDSDGFKIVVDPRDLPIIDEITVDYVRNGLNEGFEFINQKERDRCGCGESFRI
jgi:iron-sulfur cluster assembly protein